MEVRPAQERCETRVVARRVEQQMAEAAVATAEPVEVPTVERLDFAVEPYLDRAGDGDGGGFFPEVAVVFAVRTGEQVVLGACGGKGEARAASKSPARSQILA